ncbi:MAG: hypothetical protein KDE01_34670, partial [Caldilineaceae bacterium]|nr:hypothetical protein [Caldilineaceae bacterium]
MTWLLLAVLVLGILPHATAQAAPSVALVDRDRLLVQQPAADEPVQSSPDGKGYRFERAGWVYLHIEGDPYERGYQHGFLMALELADVQKMLRHITPWKTGV